MNSRDKVKEKIINDGASELLLRTFLHYYEQLEQGATGLIDQTMIETLETAPDLEQLPDLRQAGINALSRAAILKLNGGLGTGMGLDKAKSLLPVREGMNFLDIIVEQVLHLRSTLQKPLPLIFMNSFSTDADTRTVLQKYQDLAKGQAGVPLSFLQNRVPKILQDSLAPANWPANPEKEWCPPGHGDLYSAMLITGVLEQLLAAGIEYLFVSNSDNLGATLEPGILGYFSQERMPFMMEVADRTAADRKGGHIARKRSGGLVLRESAQCPDDEIESFQDITKYKYFNTNNLWINLPALSSELQKRDGILGLPLIRNSKTVDPADPSSPKVYQLETAMGAALECFNNAGVLRVPRTRFAPVKTTDDLLALWSDCYILDKDMTIKPNPARNRENIDIRLDPAHYKMIGAFLERFPEGAPSLLECNSLIVNGDVRFGKNVRISGNAVIENKHTRQLLIENREIDDAG